MDRSRTPISLTSTRIGRTDLGEGTLLIDDDSLTIVVRTTADEKPIRVSLGSVDDVRLADDGEIMLALRDGTHLVFATPAAASVRDELMLRCRTLPEFTRALRAFGSRRGHRSTRATATSDQQRFFAPLLVARRNAGVAIDPAAVVEAFSATALSQAVETALRELARERHGESGPARRALEAELEELVEPLFAALKVLADAGARAAESPDDLRLWRAWAGQLRLTFEVADRAWMSLDAALDVVPWRAPSAPSSRK